jgi:hypothetical protein
MVTTSIPSPLDGHEFHAAQHATISFREKALAKLNKSVTPARAGVQKTLKNLDSCYRRNDVQRFVKRLRITGNYHEEHEAHEEP